MRPVGLGMKTHYADKGQHQLLRWTVYPLIATRQQLRKHVPVVFFCNPILYAISTSKFSKLCKNIYTVACRRVLTSTAL
jgi:hypothetical protein